MSEDRLDRLLPRLERAARRHLAFGLSLAGAGAFPSQARANVLWSGLSGDRKALGELAMSVSAGAGRAGAPPPDEGRRYRPHVTLARCRVPADVRAIVDDSVRLPGTGLDGRGDLPHPQHAGRAAALRDARDLEAGRPPKTG